MHRRHLLALSAATLAWRAAAHAATMPILTRIDTALGSFVIAVNRDVAPRTVANFLAYVDGHFLDGGSVYRLVTSANQPAETRHKIEVVQWGMNLGDGRAPPFEPIPHESTRETGLRHLDGTVSMARNAPGTAASEFFICIGDQPELNFGGRRNPDGQGFAAFGRVTQGREVVQALHGRATAQQFLDQPIPIRSVRRVG